MTAYTLSALDTFNIIINCVLLWCTEPWVYLFPWWTTKLLGSFLKVCLMAKLLFVLQRVHKALSKGDNGLNTVLHLAVTEVLQEVTQLQPHWLLHCHILRQKAPVKTLCREHRRGGERRNDVIVGRWTDLLAVALLWVFLGTNCSGSSSSSRRRRSLSSWITPTTSSWSSIFSKGTKISELPRQGRRRPE